MADGVPYGQWALVKVQTELCDQELGVRQAALASLCDLVHNHELAYAVIQSGFMEKLKALLQDNNNHIRVKTAEVLYVLASLEVGREAFFKCDIISPLTKLIESPDSACRNSVHLVLNRLVESPSAADALVSLGLVPMLVQKVPDEEEDLRATIISTLSLCVRATTLREVEQSTVQVLKDQLSHASVNVRKAAASTLVGISITADGKMKVCEEDLMPTLVNLLSEDDQELIAEAAGVIMFTAVITEGKSQALNAGAVSPLLRLVQSPNTAVCLYALKALTVLAEAPGGQAQLLEHVPLLENLRQHTLPIIQRAAATAISVICWKP